MASISARALVYGAAGLLGAGLGAIGVMAWPRPEVEALSSLAARLESGRWRDLAAVTAYEGPDSPIVGGLKAEAHARLWSEFDREPTVLDEAHRAIAAVPRPWADATWLAHALTSTSVVEGTPPPTPKGRVAQSLVTERRGRPEKALIQLVDAARDQPRRRNTQLALARMHMRRGAWSAARDVLDALVDERPEDPLVWALDGRVRVRLREPVRPVPTSADLAPPELAVVLTTQALAAAAESRFEEAAKVIDEIQTKAPHRAALLLWAGRAKEAEAVYERSKDSLGVARSRFLRRLGACGIDVRPGRLSIDDEVQSVGGLEPDLWPLARFVPNPNVFPEHLYRSALRPELGTEVQTEDPTEVRALSAANRVGLARMCLAAGQAARATYHLERAARIEGELVRPELRARALLEAGRPRSALGVLVRIPEAERTPMQRLWFARALRARGRQEDALELLAPVAADPEVLAPSVLRLTTTLEWELQKEPVSLERLRRVAPDDVGGRLLSSVARGTPASVSSEEVAAFVDEPGWSDLGREARLIGSLKLWSIQPKRAERALRALIRDGSLEALSALGARLFEDETRRAEGQKLLEAYLESAEDGPGAEQARDLLGVE